MPGLGEAPDANRRARVRRKGGAIDVIVWQTGTARLLPRLLRGRKTGPVFVTERRARVQLPAVRPGPGRARPAELPAGRGHLQGRLRRRDPAPLRRGARSTHDAEDGTGTPMPMARSGAHLGTVAAQYARVSGEALRRHQAGRDPARRR